MSEERKDNEKMKCIWCKKELKLKDVANAEPII